VTPAEEYFTQRAQRKKRLLAVYAVKREDRVKNQELRKGE